MSSLFEVDDLSHLFPDNPNDAAVESDSLVDSATLDESESDEEEVVLAAELPHKDLAISPTAPLLECKRKRCPTCREKARYYCPLCLVPRGPVTPPSLPPLPWTYDVFKHNQERKGKSTALHVKVLCPNESNVWTYPQDVEAYSAQADPSKTLVLYPSARAQPISAIDPTTFTNIVVLDGTWYQAHQMARDTPILQDPRVRHVSFAAPPQTKFWRHQQKGGDHLATIEAMWWLLREYMVAHLAGEDYHRYDDLLWYFTFTYQRILGEYAVKEERKLTRQMKGQFRTAMFRVRAKGEVVRKEDVIKGKKDQKNGNNETTGK